MKSPYDDLMMKCLDCGSTRLRAPLADSNLLSHLYAVERAARKANDSFWKSQAKIMAWDRNHWTQGDLKDEAVAAVVTQIKAFRYLNAILKSRKAKRTKGKNP